MSERETSSSSGQRCPRCGADPPAGTPADLCPKCLLQAALATQAEPSQSETVIIPPMPSPARGPQPGEQLGHYRVVRMLGEGGMGAVYDAEDLESGRRVALKLLGHKLDSPQARERFFREGRMAASINHPNSVYVFGTEEIGGTPAIAMELVAGGTLLDRVRERGPLPVAEAVDCVLQIVAGLEAAQRIGILHRDVKPSNCFCELDGTVKVGDFGLSISTAVRTEPALTATGMFLGTPAFCSPEQLRGDELNVRSDMYSVGATLFFLLTGRTPFEGKNSVQLMATVLEQRAPSPAKFRPGIPAGVVRIVLRCLEKVPGDRFKNYHELSKALAPYSSIAPTPATLGLRFAAGVLDQLFISMIGMTATYALGSGPFDFLNLAGRSSPLALAVLGPVLAASVAYYTFLEGLWGATLGKALCHLRVVRPEGNVPGCWRALIRALIYVVLPMLPFWLFYAPNQKAYVYSSTAVQTLLGFSLYLVLGLLFCRARRRNGFAALQDFASKTRVVSRIALESRPALTSARFASPALESGHAIGPYQVLEKLENSGGIEWLLGYDLRLLRKVWIRVVPPGTPPVPIGVRNLGRANRLRWLTGRRSANENWDAFECPSGKPLLNLARTRQPWAQVRYWLYDLATEIGLATREGTLPPTLTLDRVWITDDGRAKLLDFPAPGASAVARLGDAPSPGFAPFLTEVAGAALTGSDGLIDGHPFRVPLPLHARDFLQQLSQLPSADAAAATLKPLLQRVAEVTRLRRAAVVAGCLVMPIISALGLLMGVEMLHQWERTNPGLVDLYMLLQQHNTVNSHWMKNQPHPSDRQFEIYIASHYRSIVTNDAAWNGGVTMSLIRGDMRRFAERSIADFPAPTDNEMKDANEALKKQVASLHAFDLSTKPWFLLFVAGITLFMYVCIPAVIAAPIFRGGLVLLAARVAFVRENGERASRLRLLGRAMITWSPLLFTFIFAVFLKTWLSTTTVLVVAAVLLFIGAIISLALPERGLQDRLTGVWPVPR